MIYKTRTKNLELQTLDYLHIRMDLPDMNMQHLFNLKKGYEGEIMFDSLTEKLQCECLILNDLLLKTNLTMFQIDSLIITPDTIYVFEVKNYEGDYYYEADKIYKKPRFEIVNPLNQLSRSETLLHQLLQNLGFNLSIRSLIVFINPEFTLYQSPLDKPFIFPTQINQYLNKISANTAKLNATHMLLAEKLTFLHIEDSQYNQLPSYDYHHLKKGITCSACQAFSVAIKGKMCFCYKCGHEEMVESAVLRSVNEYRTLFPDKKITTNVIHDWCKVVPSKKRIKRILGKHFKLISNKRWSYFE